VTQQPNIIQAQNLITESGQNLGIQIVAAESLEPAQLHHTINEQIGIVQQQSQHSNKNDKQKCISCGGHIQNAKRKGPKLIRCETCIQNDTNAQNVRPTQIFVSQDGDIKFEVNESPNLIQIQNALPAKMTAKKKNVTTVTKCTTCNGTGVVIVTDNTATSVPAQQQQSTVVHSSKSASSRPATTSSPQKIPQQVQLQTISHHAVSPPPLQQTQQHHPVQHHAPPQNQSVQSQNDKPFSCNICGGKFSRYSSLWSHKKLHSGEKNYKV
jgi:KRAB domain-containing zinc finger protein